ncbi:Rossmann fold nucleotide-binding protein [Nocardioides sp.]|uniref:LOG family protein n=1 Tax=Nocardioides sp. TaxID=35761 RepID=UPI002618375B|nr:Rossmann fold nucleotide-binding protein [Nocardioides sp.]
MRRERGRVILVETLADFDRRLSQGVTSLRGWRLRGLDLRERSVMLGAVSLGGAMFVGCTFAPGDAEWVESRGALVMPVIRESPLDPYRGTLYTPDELYDTPDYPSCLDARAYAWSQTGGNGEATLARALHDHAIDEALERWIQGRRIVGVMGGHDADRGSQAFGEAAGLGRHLARISGVTVATGGGPGAMEAANLGARLSLGTQTTLDEACARLSTAASFRPSIQAWVDAARAVLAETADTVETTESLGIPTWHYGHEPPNLFATSIAKYFRNSLREATLLAICGGGVVFLPGAAGTVQEVFQDACENYYADPSSLAPMVLVGHDYWTQTLPVWPLLTRLAGERDMAPLLHLVDSAAEAADVIGSYAG